MRLLAAALAFCVTFPLLGAIKTEKVEYKDGDVVLEGYLAYDDALTGKRPGVLVCHEWWGNNDYSRGRAEQLAAAGLKVLTGNARVDGGKVAVIGYCMGGTVALELARSGAEVAAAVSFHGGLATQEPAKAGAVKARVLVCNGADDAMVPPEQRAAFEKEMKDAGVDFVFIDYAGAQHAFTNPGADAHKIPGIAYNERADKRSWRHMMDLFAEVFGPAPGQGAGEPEKNPGAGRG